MIKYFRHAPLIFWSTLLIAGAVTLLALANVSDNEPESDLAALAEVSAEPSHAIGTRAQMESFPALVSAADHAPLMSLAGGIAARSDLAADRRIAAYGDSDELAKRYREVSAAGADIIAVAATGDRSAVLLAASRMGATGDVLVSTAMGNFTTEPIADYGIPGNDMFIPTPFVDSFGTPGRSSLPSHEELQARLG